METSEIFPLPLHFLPGIPGTRMPFMIIFVSWKAISSYRPGRFSWGPGSFHEYDHRNFNAALNLRPNLAHFDFE